MNHHKSISQTQSDTPNTKSHTIPPIPPLQPIININNNINFTQFTHIPQMPIPFTLKALPFTIPSYTNNISQSNNSHFLPSLSYDYEQTNINLRSNTPHSDDQSIVSTNTVNTANTTNTLPNISVSLSNFGVNDHNSESCHIPIQSHTKSHTPLHSLLQPIKLPKSKPKSKKTRKKRKHIINDDVLPIAKGHGSIEWTDVCETKLHCHICENTYSDRTSYIDCLKAHYNDSNNDLEYLVCDLCLTNPTKKNMERRKKLGQGSDDKSWRMSKHVANFISHLAGHKGMKAGFYCKVRVYNEELGKYERCTESGSTQQNLAKHIYNMHYKCGDSEGKYVIDPCYGYVKQKKLKKLIKNGKKRKRVRKEKKSEFVVYDTAEPKKKRRKLTEKVSEIKRLDFCSEQGQFDFLRYLTFASGVKLGVLADCASEESISI